MCGLILADFFFTANSNLTKGKQLVQNKWRYSNWMHKQEFGSSTVLFSHSRHYRWTATSDPKQRISVKKSTNSDHWSLNFKGPNTWLRLGPLFMMAAVVETSVDSSQHTNGIRCSWHRPPSRWGLFVPLRSNHQFLLNVPTEVLTVPFQMGPITECLYF